MFVVVPTAGKEQVTEKMFKRIIQIACGSEVLCWLLGKMLNSKEKEKLFFFQSAVIIITTTHIVRR